MNYSVESVSDMMFRKQLQAILEDINARLNVAGGLGGFDGQYSSLTGIPSTFNPSAHNHTESEITDLGDYQPLASVLTNTTASFTSALDTKLAGIESNATADQTGAEIVTSINVELGGTSWQSGGGGSSDHGGLTGLGDDDHTQYHTDARGDIRYYTQTQLNAGQLDTRYYTETETDSLLSGKADTSHTHTEADITDLGSYQPLDSVLTNTTASYTSTEETKLAGIEPNATADQSDSEIVAAVNNELGGTDWQSGGGGGGGTTIETFSATKNGNQNLTGNSYQDVTGYDAATYSETGTFNATTGEWTCGATGKYVVKYSLTLDQYSGNNRDSAFARLVLDGTLIKGTEKHGYHRQNAHGHNNYSSERTIPITSGQVVKLQCRNESTSRLHRVNADSLVFEIERYS